MRIVVDTNVFISFLLTKNETIVSFFNLWRRQKLTFLVTDEIIAEISEVVERFIAKKKIFAKDGFSLIRRVKRKSEKVISLSEVNLSSDKKDNRYLACALDGRADYLITGDKKHLLLLKTIGKTKIISPKDFLKELK